MKTNNNFLKSLFIIGFSFSTLLLDARTNNNESVMIETEKTIKASLKFPEGLIVNQKIEVLFTTNQTGNVNFVLAKTNNISLKKEIEKQFSALQLTKLKENVVHSLVLNFKTI